MALHSDYEAWDPDVVPVPGQERAVRERARGGAAGGSVLSAADK